MAISLASGNTTVVSVTTGKPTGKLTDKHTGKHSDKATGKYNDQSRFPQQKNDKPHTSPSNLRALDIREYFQQILMASGQVGQPDQLLTKNRGRLPTVV